MNFKPDLCLEGLSALPFFLKIGEGQPKLNSKRIIEGFIIGLVVSIVTTLAISLFAIPMTVKELQKDIDHLTVSNIELKVQLEKNYSKLEILQQQITVNTVRIEGLQDGQKNISKQIN